MKKNNFRSLSRFISETIQDMVIVRTMEDKYELVCNMSNDAISPNLDFKFLQPQVTWKWYKIEPYNGRLIGNTLSVVFCHFQRPWTTLIQISRTPY